MRQIDPTDSLCMIQVLLVLPSSPSHDPVLYLLKASLYPLYQGLYAFCKRPEIFALIFTNPAQSHLQITKSHSPSCLLRMLEIAGLWPHWYACALINDTQAINIVFTPLSISLLFPFCSFSLVFFSLSISLLSKVFPSFLPSTKYYQ